MVLNFLNIDIILWPLKTNDDNNNVLTSVKRPTSNGDLNCFDSKNEKTAHCF